jgi:hypothetical protein
MQNVEQAVKHFKLQHTGADGWITIAKKEDGIYRQFHYEPEEATYRLSEWLGEDVYFSQNTFYLPQRQIANIRQLRSLYVDIDCYLLNYEPVYILSILEEEIFKRKIPDPSFIIFSGKGIILIWRIEPLPYQALPLWQVIQNYLCEQVKAFGGDVKALDAARVFRIAGSINSKNGEMVRIDYRHDYLYTLREIQQEYLPDLNPDKQKKKGRKKKVVQLHNIYRLHTTRLYDLVKLTELRQHDVKGYRETMCFLYRYWSCCVLNDSDEALRQTLEFNSQFVEPLSKREVVRATKSAEKAWSARSNVEANQVAKEKGYPGAGYNLTNAKIIQWLDITLEEQQQLATIISKKEYRRRDAVYQFEKRQAEGKMTRNEYLEQEQEKTEDKLYLLRRVLQVNPKATQKELAKMLGVDRSYISKLKNKL